MSVLQWYSLEIKEVFEKLRSSEEGLSENEVRLRLEEYGPNELVEEKVTSSLEIFVAQFKSPLVMILLFAIILSLLVGEVIDAVTIIAIVLASSTLGFYQEYRAEKALAALKRLASPTALVLRDGREVTIPARELVPGDVLLLFAGDRVPADARIIESVNLKVDESSLTGESVAVSKLSETLPPDVPLPDRKNMVYAGTVITYGRGKAIVVATGMNTELGKIAASLQRVEKEKTPLEKKMEYIGKILIVLCLGVATFVSFIGLVVWRYDILTMVIWAVSLAVAAVPEALPAVVTGALAVGMYRMAKRNAIMRKLPAVETLGCTTFICSDKTGTMTKGEMTIRKIYLLDKVIEVTGVGYEPKGEFKIAGARVDPLSIEELKFLLLNCELNNDAKLEYQNGKWVLREDPTEGALLVLARKAGLSPDTQAKYYRIGEIPFSSERKRMTTFNKTPEGKVLAFIKGAPEIVLSLCDKVMVNGKIRELKEENKKKIMRVVEEFASEGLRNLAFAFRESSAEEANRADETVEREFVFLGFVGMMDPPRPEIKEALKICRMADVKVSMVTGDHKLTAEAVARELGLFEDGIVLTGTDLDKMSDEELEKIVEDVKVYARVSPEHKLRIVRALKRRGHVVAMTGDGVNDAPALKAADIGIAMGITGTEVAKEAADMILADDNFATIVDAVKQGREVYDNIKKYLAYLLGCNISEILIPLIASFTGIPLPFTAIQYLWINLATDGPPALALGVDPADPDIMERPPRRPDEPVFNKREMLVFLIAVPVLLAILLVGLLAYQLSVNTPLAGARTTVFTSMVLTELLLALSMRSLRHPIARVGVTKNKFLIVAILVSFLMQLAALYIGPLQIALDVTYPALRDWIYGIAVALATFITIEVLKYLVIGTYQRANQET